MHVNTTQAILLAITGLFVALISGALITGTALSLGGHGGARMRFVRQAEEPGLYWFTVILHGGFLAFMIWIDLGGNR
jgi:hypothetical protein